MKDLVETLRGAKNVAIVPHRDTDANTIGSGIALGLALDSLGKRVTLHCADAVPEHARFLTWADRYTTEPPPATTDIIVTVDFGSAERAKFALPAGPTLVNIDHHASNDNFGSVNLVDVSSAATAELVSRVIDALGVKWTAEMATAALIGIMTDTGSFQFPSTDSRALDRAARLREAGADLQAITHNGFPNNRFQALKLWGFAFSKMRREQEGQLVWTEVTREDFAEAEALDEDISGLVEQIARSNGMRVALLFNEHHAGAIKVSRPPSPWAPSGVAVRL